MLVYNPGTQDQSWICLSWPICLSEGKWTCQINIPTLYAGKGHIYGAIVIVQSNKVCLNLCDPMNCSTADFSVLPYLPELSQTHVHWVRDAIHPSLTLPPSLALLPSIIPALEYFFNEPALNIRWPKDCIFSFRISSSNEYTGWVFQYSASFMVQLSIIHDY